MTNATPQTISQSTAAPVLQSQPSQTQAQLFEKEAPEGFILHTESSTSILFACADKNQPLSVFLNPVQEYNRDTSVVAIRCWSELRQEEKVSVWEAGVKKRWAKKQEKGGKKRKGNEGESIEVAQEEPKEDKDKEFGGDKEDTRVLTPPTYKFTLLEALSATGLRAIRYAKEIPLLQHVVANDLSSSAVQDIKRNIAHNNLEPAGIPVDKSEVDFSKTQLDLLKNGIVRVNEGDACTYMYTHRTPDTRFDCIDLDPYGSAVPFLDAAIGAVQDGGLLCVTCTDAGVLAGHNYPEKAYTHYGGVCIKAEYSHEVGLRLILNAIASTAAKYGRSIEPLVSLSIDFYMRVFVRVHTSPKQVKELPSKTNLLYYCHDCSAPYFQPMGRMNERKSEKTGEVYHTFHVPAGPPKGVSDSCPECGGRFHIGGPMWGGRLHDPAFVERMLKHIEKNGDQFKTVERMKGMLTVVASELEAPLYFTPQRLCSMFHATSPSLNLFASAVVNAGYQISRSHASPGSIKTNAPHAFLMDIIREWIKQNPLKSERFKPGSLAKRLSEKEQTHEVTMALNGKVGEMLKSQEGLVRYQMNPEKNWGPGRAAVKGVKKQKAQEKK